MWHFIPEQSHLKHKSMCCSGYLSHSTLVPSLTPLSTSHSLANALINVPIHVSVHSLIGQKVTVNELINDEHFVQMILADKSITGEGAKKIALSTGGRMPGSVSVRIAREARNIILNASAIFYDADWCKMKGLGREFLAKNPGSHFKLEVDSQNRCAYAPARFHRPEC